MQMAPIPPFLTKAPPTRIFGAWATIGPALFGDAGCGRWPQTDFGAFGAGWTPPLPLYLNSPPPRPFTWSPAMLLSVQCPHVV